MPGPYSGPNQGMKCVYAEKATGAWLGLEWMLKGTEESVKVRFKSR
jgi:hypothetical protein